MNGLLERFTSPLGVDAYLSALHPLWSRRRGIVEAIVPQTATASSILIRPSRDWAGHQPGQFVTVSVDVDGVRHQRCYSLTSVPDRPDGRIEITVQATPDGTVSRHLVHRAQPGDVIGLGPAEGDFTLAGTDGPLLFVSAGSGITPIMGMLRSIAEVAAERDVVVVHHAPGADRAIFGDELATLGRSLDRLRLEVVLTREPGGRHLDAARLDDLCPDWSERDAFVCGPAGLLDFATERWSAHGAVDRLHLERFVPAGFVPAGSAPGIGDDATGGTVRFAASGIDAAPATVADASTTLLDAAEANGLAPPSGCRMGICHTCSTPLLAGCARDLRDGRLVEAEVGTHVQLCVSTAVGDVTLDL